jgi:hypothetical protein
VPNTSIKNGTFISCFKKCVTKPIPKNITMDEEDNYHPVTIVSDLSKVLEKVISNPLVSFLDKHNILINSQFGFRIFTSTKMQ